MRFGMIRILGLLGKYFDAVVIEVKTFLLFFQIGSVQYCGTSDEIQKQIFNLLLKYRRFSSYNKI